MLWARLSEKRNTAEDSVKGQMTNIYGLFQRAEEQILMVQNLKKKTSKNEKKREENMLRLHPMDPERSKHSVN